MCWYKVSTCPFLGIAGPPFYERIRVTGALMPMMLLRCDSEGTRLSALSAALWTMPVDSDADFQVPPW